MAALFAVALGHRRGPDRRREPDPRQYRLESPYPEIRPPEIKRAELAARLPDHRQRTGRNFAAVAEERAFVPDHNKNGRPQPACFMWKLCRRVGIQGVSLHSYRYAWAERAKIAGLPQR